MGLKCPAPSCLQAVLLEVRATSVDHEGLLCGLTDRPEGLLTDCCLKLSVQVKGQPLLLVASFGIVGKQLAQLPIPSPTWVRELDSKIQWAQGTQGRGEAAGLWEGQALPAGTQLDLKMVQEHRLAELKIQPESHLWRSGPEPEH